MNPYRFALVIAALAAGAIALPSAHAQSWPNKPVVMIVPQAAGGTNDIVARLVAAELGPKLGQTFVVENRPGAGGNIGTAAAARATPDGYTLLMQLKQDIDRWAVIVKQSGATVD